MSLDPYQVHTLVTKVLMCSQWHLPFCMYLLSWIPVFNVLYISLLRVVFVSCLCDLTVWGVKELFVTSLRS